MDPPDEWEALASDQCRIARKSAMGEPSIGIDSIEIVGGCSQLSLPGGVVASCAICLSMTGLNPLCASWATATTDLDYRATFLAYREGPALVKALDLLPLRPQVLLVPAAGIDHPRGLGMARHVGYLLSLPTIGVMRRPLPLQGRTVPSSTDESSCLPFCPGPGRARIYVSRGWGVDGPTSLEIVRLCTRNHRMPEPIHLAKALCRKMSKDLAGPFT